MPALSPFLGPRGVSQPAQTPHRSRRMWMRGQSSPVRSLVRLLSVGSLIAGGLLGCSDLGGKPPLPSGIPKQEALKTPAGARQLYQGALATFQYGRLNGGPPSWGALLSSVLTQGMLSDELTVNSGGGSGLDYLNGGPAADYATDSRNLPEGSDAHAEVYNLLQTLRERAAEALGALAQYDSSEQALRGHLDALTGYAELYLADVFCSGVPLSTFDYNQDFTYRPGSPTDSVYADAARQFQAALPLLRDSVQWLNLARVGLGRAYLNLGKYNLAAAAVRQVPDGYTYGVPVDWSDGTGAAGALLTGTGVPGGYAGFAATMADTEGGAGQPSLPYLSSHDPRTAGVAVRQFQYINNSGNGIRLIGDSLYFPTKYGDGLATMPVVVASGVEARLIEAEAALHGVNVGRDWLTILNGLRQPLGLGDLTDPGASPGDTARVRLLFRERAFWLYLDGHRLGDLRRLLRRYGQQFHLPQVFPTGPYWVPVPQYPNYGLDVELPIPSAELKINPLFTGCLRRGI